MRTVRNRSPEGVYIRPCFKRLTHKPLSFRISSPYRKRTVAGLVTPRTEGQLVYPSVVDSSPQQTADWIILAVDPAAEHAGKQRAAQQRCCQLPVGHTFYHDFFLREVDCKAGADSV